MREAKHRGAQAAKSLTINDRGPSMPQAQTPQGSQPNGDHAESRTALLLRPHPSWPLPLLAQSRGAAAPLGAVEAVRPAHYSPIYGCLQHQARRAYWRAAPKEVEDVVAAVDPWLNQAACSRAGWRAALGAGERSNVQVRSCRRAVGLGSISTDE